MAPAAVAAAATAATEAGGRRISNVSELAAL